MSKRRRAVDLHAQGLSTAQIGEILDATTSEVATMLYQARRHDEKVAARKGEVVQ